MVEHCLLVTCRGFTARLNESAVWIITLFFKDKNDWTSLFPTSNKKKLPPPLPSPSRYFSIGTPRKTAANESGEKTHQFASQQFLCSRDVDRHEQKGRPKRNNNNNNEKYVFRIRKPAITFTKSDFDCRRRQRDDTPLRFVLASFEKNSSSFCLHGDRNS